MHVEEVKNKWKNIGGALETKEVVFVSLCPSRMEEGLCIQPKDPNRMEGGLSRCPYPFQPKFPFIMGATSPVSEEN